MTFPDDLPWVIEYRVGPVRDRDGKWVWISQKTYPHRAVRFRGSSGTTDAASVCPRIPYGTTAWKVLGEVEWRPLEEIPPAWLPFLQRERGTEMDPRHKQCRVCNDAAGADGLCPRHSNIARDKKETVQEDGSQHWMVGSHWRGPDKDNSAGK